MAEASQDQDTPEEAAQVDTVAPEIEILVMIEEVEEEDTETVTIETDTVDVVDGKCKT